MIDDNKFYGLKDAPNKNRIAPPSVPKVQQRDRDLGQTFLTGDKGFAVESLYLRIGFSDKAVLSGAPGAKLAVQWFEVKGTPRLNDSGTPGFSSTFDRARSPELDDYIEGETYKSVRVSQDGVLPDKLAKGDFLHIAFTGKDAVTLKPNTHYAFVVLFTERSANRQLALANTYYGGYNPDPKNPLVGHGLRREGGAGRKEAPYFAPDLPDDRKKRTRLSPDTLGFPDVCTYRDLYFTITAKPDAKK